MSRERYRFIAVLVALIGQILGGVLLFGFAPQAVWVDINNDALAQYRNVVRIDPESTRKRI